MNDNRSLHDELADEARHLPLTSTGIEVILETAGRRRKRRNAAAIGSVLAITAVTVVGVQQLSRVDDTELPSASDIAPLATTTTIAASTVTPTTSYDGPWQSGPWQSGMDLSGAVPADPSAPVMTWTVVDVDSPQALALSYGGADQRYALATEPGGNEPGTRSLYEQQDGAWVQVSDNVLPEGLRQATVSGDAIYAVGTAPATGGEERGSVGRFDIATQSWDRLPLPAEARPYRTDKVMSSAEMSIAPIDGGALVVINRGSAFLDYEFVQSMSSTEGQLQDFRWVDGQLEVASDCDQTLLEQYWASLESAGDVSDVEAGYRQAMNDACTVETLSAADLGLSAADQAELDRAPVSLIYRYDGEALTPVESPIPAGSGVSLLRNVLMAYTSDGVQAWLVQPDGSFDRIFADLGSLDGTWIREFDGVLATGASGVVVTGAPGGPTSLIDLSSLVTDDTMRNPNASVYGVASNETATVAAVSVEYQRADSIAEPTTIEGATYNLVVDPNNGVTLVERATGRTLADGYQLATEPGALKLIARTGDDLAYTDSTSTTIVPMTVPATTEPTPDVTSPAFDVAAGEVIDQFDVDWQTLAPWSQARTTKIASSIDGRSYAVESLADLVGAGPDERVEANTVDIVDGRFIVRGWVTGAGYNGSSRSVILIGTPNG